MDKSNHPHPLLLQRTFVLPAWGSLLKLVCVAVLVAGCGGGGGNAGSTRTSYAYGPITGFGSIIVNGVRFDDNSAGVSSDDDDNGESRSKSDLKLGMVVEVRGGETSSDASGTRRSSASEIRFGSEIVGPVGTVDLAAKTFTLLGQTVAVGANTIFDNSSSTLGSLDDIQPGQVLEVHGMFDASAKIYNATRIERETSASQYKIRGAVEGLTSTTFKIGTETINYAGVTSGLPSNFANGSIVRVKLQITRNGAGEWVATRVKSGIRTSEDHSEAEIKGTISGFTTIASTFSVDGITVDGSAAVAPSNLANGMFVEVEGSLSNGVLSAKKIKLEDSIAGVSVSFEFHGRVTELSTDRTSFKVRDTLIKVVTGTVFERGVTAANIANGMCVEVKARASMEATLIKSDNDCAP